MEGVGGLSRLADEEAGVITEDGSLAIEEIRSKLYTHGQRGELLKELTSCKGAVVGGTTSKEDQAPATTDGVDVVGETSEEDFTGLEINTATHGVEDGLSLLVDLLEHEVGISSFGDGVELHLEGLNGEGRVSAVSVSEEGERSTAVEVENILILQINDLLGVLHNGVYI